VSNGSSGASEKLRVTGKGDITTKELTSLATPTSGFGNWGCKTDGLPYFKNDAGTEILPVQLFVLLLQH